MLRYGRLIQPQAGLQFLRRAFPADERLQHPNPDRVGQRPEKVGLELLQRMFHNITILAYNEQTVKEAAVMHDAPAAHPGRIASIRALGKGARVWQPTYGCGTVTDVDDMRVRVDFDEHGSRLFARSLVTLLPTEIPAPPPSSKRPPRRKSVL